MKKIKLTQNKFALIDDEDFDKVSEYKWFYGARGYAVHSDYKNHRTIYMHKLIMNTKDKEEIDHKDMNGINNQKSNLRIATHQQNNLNKKIRPDSSTGYKGVYLTLKKYNRKKPWLAYINMGKRRINLEYCLTAKEAALVYNKAAKKFFGEFAYLNQI